MSTRLDAIDLKILTELQSEGRITNVELARRVGISAPPCLRRVRALEEAGFIRGYRALLDEKLLGFEVTVFAMVHLSSQAEADLKRVRGFRARSAARARMLDAVGRDRLRSQMRGAGPQDLPGLRRRTDAAPNVRNVKTSLTLRNSKDAAMVPMELKRPA